MAGASKYDPSLCDKIREMFSDGSSITKVCALKLKVGRSQYYEWKEKYPDFKKAAEEGEELAEAIHEAKLEAGADGEIENYNAASRIFIMKSRFRKTYGEEKNQEKSAAESLLEQIVLGKVQVINSDKKG